MKSLKKKSKCRLTGRPIGLFLLGPEDDVAAWRTVTAWIYIDGTQAAGLQERMETKFYPLPQDFCWRSTYEGDPCQSKIRPENIRAQLWACGRHMGRFQEEEDRKRRNAEQQKINAQREELEQWELEEAVRVYEALQELGWGAVLPPQPPNKPRWGGYGIRDANIQEITQAEFLALVAPPSEEEEEYDDDEFASVEEDFFTSDL